MIFAAVIIFIIVCFAYFARERKRKTIKENCLRFLSQVKTDFEKAKNKQIPEVFKDISQKIINTELKTTSKDKPEIIVLTCITAYCLKNLSTYNLSLKEKTNLVYLLDFATELSRKKDYIPTELYKRQRILIDKMYLTLTEEILDKIKNIPNQR